MATIEFEVDHERRIAIVRQIGAVDGQMLLARLPPFWQAHPEIATYHSLSDMTRFDGDLGYDDLRQIAVAWQAFCGGRDGGAYTAVASRDPFAWLYVKAIALNFPTRKFGVFRSVDAALRWIEGRG